MSYFALLCSKDMFFVDFWWKQGKQDRNRQLSLRSIQTRKAAKTCVIPLDFKKWGRTINTCEYHHHYQPSVVALVDQNGQDIYFQMKLQLLYRFGLKLAPSFLRSGGPIVLRSVSVGQFCKCPLVLSTQNSWHLIRYAHVFFHCIGIDCARFNYVLASSISHTTKVVTSYNGSKFICGCACYRFLCAVTVIWPETVRQVMLDYKTISFISLYGLLI